MNLQENFKLASCFPFILTLTRTDRCQLSRLAYIKDGCRRNGDKISKLIRASAMIISNKKQCATIDFYDNTQYTVN